MVCRFNFVASAVLAEVKIAADIEARVESNKLPESDSKEIQPKTKAKRTRRQTPEELHRKAFLRAAKQQRKVNPASKEWRQEAADAWSELSESHHAFWENEAQRQEPPVKPPVLPVQDAPCEQLASQKARLAR